VYCSDFLWLCWLLCGCFSVHNQPELVYHRIDLLPHDKMCLHLKQLSTLGKSRTDTLLCFFNLNPGWFSVVKAMWNEIFFWCLLRMLLKELYWYNNLWQAVLNVYVSVSGILLRWPCVVEGMLTSNNLPSVKKCAKTHYCDMQSCQSEMAVSVLKKRLPVYERFKRTLILTEWCKTCTNYQGGLFFKKDSSLQTSKKTAFSWLNLMCRKIDTGLMLHKEQLVQKRKKFAHFVLPCSLSWQRQFSLHMLWYVCVLTVCVCVCVLSVDRCHKTRSYLLVCWHRSAQCSYVCVCCLCWQKSAQCSSLCICYMCMLSVLTEISTVFLSMYRLHVCVVCVDILSVYRLHVCVVCVDRDQHSVPVPKQLHQPFWTSEWGRDKAECAELPGLPEGWHTTHHQPWTQGKLTWPGLPDWLITNPGHKVNWPHLPYWRMAHNSSPTLGLKVNWLKLVYLKDTWLITSPGFR